MQKRRDLTGDDLLKQGKTKVFGSSATAALAGWQLRRNSGSPCCAMTFGWRDFWLTGCCSFSTVRLVQIAWLSTNDVSGGGSWLLNLELVGYEQPAFQFQIRFGWAMNLVSSAKMAKRQLGFYRTGVTSVNIKTLNGASLSLSICGEWLLAQEMTQNLAFCLRLQQNGAIPWLLFGYYHEVFFVQLACKLKYLQNLADLNKN